MASHGHEAVQWRLRGWYEENRENYVFIDVILCANFGGLFARKCSLQPMLRGCTPVIGHCCVTPFFDADSDTGLRIGHDLNAIKWKTVAEISSLIRSRLQ